MDTFFRSVQENAHLPLLITPDHAVPESPSVAVAEALALQHLRVSSIHAASRARLLTVGIDAKLADVAALMSGAQLGMAVVCGLSGSVAGVIADTMLIQQLGLGVAGIFAMRAGDLMAPNFTTCSQTDSLTEVLSAMHSQGHTHVLVVDAENRPLGVVYARDGLRELLAAGNLEEQQLLNYIMGIGYR